MSSFIVSPKVINRIVTFLEDRTEQYSRSMYKDSYQKLLSRYLIGYLPENNQKLCGALWSLNIKATGERYDEEREDKLPGAYTTPIFESQRSKLIHHTPFVHAEASTIQVFKSLNCLIYQCSEGNVPNEPLYKFLEDLENTLAREIAESLPEYDKAEWD